MKKILAMVCAGIIAAHSTAFAFSDVSGHWAQNDIQIMSAAGYINGYPDGTFLPDKPVTKAEFLKIMTLRYDITQNEDGYLMWSDVGEDEWYSPYSAAGAILPMSADGRLDPNGDLQRYEAAVALLTIYDIDYINNISDSAKTQGDYSEYADDEGMVSLISAVIDSKIMNGKENGFEPFDYLTRAELCTLLNRLKSRDADITKTNDIINSIIAGLTGQSETENNGNGNSDTENNSDVSEYKQMVFELVNAEREKNGLDPLKWDIVLEAAADLHSMDMVERDFFSHVSPDGKTMVERIKAAGEIFGEDVTYMSFAENIAAGQMDPESVMESWMNSEGHRANILDPDLTHIGVGIAYGGDYGIYWTQCFGG